MRKMQQEVIFFYNNTMERDFQKYQLVLLWNKTKKKRYFHTNFEALWISPYQIEKVIDFNSYFLKDMRGTVQ